MEPSSFKHFLLRSLGVLEAEKPRVHAALCALLAGKELHKDLTPEKARTFVQEVTARKG